MNEQNDFKFLVAKVAEDIAVCKISWEQEDGSVIRGKGRSTDTVNATAYALIDVLNRTKIRDTFIHQGI